MRIALAIAIGVASVVTFAPTRASADTPGESRDLTDLQKARQRFDQALALEKEGRWAEALEALESVAEVKRTPHVEYHLALCSKNVGKMRDAVLGFRRALDLARAGPAGTADEVLQNAPEQLQAMTGLVGRLFFEVEGHGRFRIFVDGTLVPLSELDRPVPVDPGKHEVAIETTDARGETSTRKKRTEVGAGEERRVVFTLPREQVASEARSAGTSSDGEGDGDAPPGEQARDRGSEEPVRWPSYVAFGVAGAGAILTGVFIGLRQEAIDTVTASCRDPIARTGCDPRARETADRGLTYQGAAIGAAAGTVAAVAAGIGLWIAFTPSRAEPVRSTLVVVPGYAGFQGTF